MRYARVSIKDRRRDPDVIRRYMPDNYHVIETRDDHVIVAGEDHAGWTLDDYVLPRLASGLWFGREIHPENTFRCPDCGTQYPFESLARECSEFCDAEHNAALAAESDDL